MKTEAEIHRIQFGSRYIQYTLYRSDRKCLRIVVSPDLSVDIFAPLGKSDEEVHSAIQKKAPWITKKLNQLESFHPLPVPKHYVSGETLVYLGRQYRLKIMKGPAQPPKLTGRFLCIWVEDNTDTEKIATKIYVIRHVKVMLDRDLAELYSVETKVLKQAVRRNIKRFPEDFMFELTQKELSNLRSQIVTSSWGGTRYAPMAFTEQGVAMLSSVLRSEKAIKVNIEIMRIFSKLRQIILDNNELKRELEELKHVTEERFQIVFETLDQMLAVESTPKQKIGFTVKEKQRVYSKN